MKGYTLEIYRSNYDCPLNKMMGKKQVTLIDKDSPQIFEPDLDSPPVKLVRRKLFGGEYIHAEPAEVEQGEHFAFGGTFIYSSDSRINEISKYPIPLHDRRMNLE